LRKEEPIAVSKGTIADLSQCVRVFDVRNGRIAA
jgi:hypothetical protein